MTSRSEAAIRGHARRWERLARLFEAECEAILLRARRGCDREAAARLGEVRGIDYDPWEHAEALAVPVVTGTSVDRRHGEYALRDDTIRLHERLTSIQARVALTHELRHALRYEVGVTGEADRRQHARVHREVIRQLCVPSEYAAASALARETADVARRIDIALTLNIGRDVVSAFEAMLRGADDYTIDQIMHGRLDTNEARRRTAVGDWRRRFDLPYGHPFPAGV